MAGLLDPAFLLWLERLRVLAGRAPASTGPGEHRSPGRGRSIEFAEHRDYRPGDDFRQIDWKAYGRLDKLFLKLFVEERERTISVLLDCSASMAAGGPESSSEDTKFDHARRLAAALAYLGLCGLNRVAVGLISDRLQTWLPPVRGRGQAVSLFRTLEAATPGGGTDLAAALKDFGARSQRPGLVLVVSDFLQPGAGLDGLRFLRYRRNDLLIAQVLDPAEVDPQEGGDLRLVDAETGGSRELTLDGRIVAAYRKALQGLCTDLEDWAKSQGCAYLRTTTDRPLQEAVSELLRRGGMIR